jgi:peroxiredoxin
MHATPELYKLKIGDTAPDFALLATDGTTHSWDTITKPIVVIIFMCNHCPYVIATIERIKSLAHQFKDKNVQFVGINANDASKYPQDSFEHMKSFVHQNEVEFPYLHDESQEVAKAFHGLLTPHVMVFKDRTLAYNGGIDNNINDASAVTEHWLRDALDALSSGEMSRVQETPCDGCSIKWKED